MINLKPFIDACVNSLEMLLNVIESVDDELYARQPENIYDSSIGLHTRHVLDHFDRFITGVDEGVVNYDARLREVKVEIDRQYAISKLTDIISSLREMEAVDKNIVVIMDVESDKTTVTHQPSSLARELAFLHSHSTHHHATLAFIFRMLGLDINIKDFGIAPGTIRHMRLLQCAP